MKRRPFLWVLLATLGPSYGARADRNILIPTGLITLPNALKVEFAAGIDRPHDNIGWTAVGLPFSAGTIEIEGEHFELGGRRRETGSLQYSLTGNLFAREGAAVSVGVRDVANNGREGRAFYVAATKDFGLSQRQERMLRSVKLHVGAGTSGLEGPFVGAQAKLTLGVVASMEYVARRFNGALALPVARNLQIRAYSLNSELFYGVSLSLVR